MKTLVMQAAGATDGAATLAAKVMGQGSWNIQRRAAGHNGVALVV